MKKFIAVGKPNRTAALLILIPMSIPLFFLSYFLIRDKYQEFFLYGERTFAILEDVSTHTPSAGGRTGGGNITYFIYHLRIPTMNNAILEDNHNYKDGSTQRLKLSDVNVGDTLSVKILSNREAKILSYKNVEISPYFAFWYNFWIFLWLIAMLFVAAFPWYLVFFNKNKWRN